MTSQPITSRTPSGAVLFARYAYPPNELGYCGPADAAGMLRAISRDGATDGVDPVDPAHQADPVDLAHEADPVDLVERARDFDGAWVYLELLAEAAGVEEPLDPRVVEAYWVGNDLLDRLDQARFERHVRARFDAQVAGRWRSLEVTTGPAHPCANHSFHVFEVYPWVGLLHSGSTTPVRVLDQCRIRWGTVLRIDGDEVVVRSQPLVWDGRALALGPARQERARWSAGGHALAHNLRPGQQVSLHWDWVCDVLTPAARRALGHYTAGQLAATNTWLASTRTTSARTTSARTAGCR